MGVTYIYTLYVHTGAFLSGPVASDEALQKQAKLYKAFQNEQVAKGAHKLLGEGALIFDEVKVVSHLLWNSRSKR